MDSKQAKRFALAGQIVSRPAQARRILRMAQVSGKTWLVPQCLSVLRQLESAA